MSRNIEQIKLLREKTGAGIASCKNALEATGGNLSNALKYLQEKELVLAEKKTSRSTKQGIVSSYIHSGKKLGVLLELNCETDFVARREEFSELAKTLALQVASNSAIEFIDYSDVPADVWSNEEQAKKVQEEGVINALKEKILLEQNCIREPETLIKDYIKKYIGLLGENIQVGSFSRIIVGQSITSAESYKQ